MIVLHDSCISSFLVCFRTNLDAIDEMFSHFIEEYVKKEVISIKICNCDKLQVEVKQTIKEKFLPFKYWQ